MLGEVQRAPAGLDEQARSHETGAMCVARLIDERPIAGIVAWVFHRQRRRRYGRSTMCGFEPSVWPWPGPGRAAVDRDPRPALGDGRSPPGRPFLWDEVQRAESAVVEFVDERLRRDGPEGVFDDAGDLAPIDAVITTGVEVDAETGGEHSRRRRRRVKGPVWFARRQVGGHARRGGAPQRDAAVAAVVVVELAKRALALHGEPRLAVAYALRDARQGQCDPAHLVELVAFHLTGLHGVGRRRAADIRDMPHDPGPRRSGTVASGPRCK